MCVIISLPPFATINKRQLFNAVYNNWHGFGLVLRDGNNKTEVIKEFNENGTDPERIWKLLEDNKDVYRHLHVRHCTKGATDESNVQPFEVYNSSSRQVYFMHNGTLSSFGGSYNNNTGKSDTLDFCEKVLQPALLRWTGENGKADYLDEQFWKLVVDKQWTYNSTGLFVSNDLDVKRIGNGWSQYKHPDDSSEGEVWVSNTSYFDRIQRGPEFHRLEAIKKAEEEAEKKAKGVADLDDEIPFLGGGTNGNNVIPMDGVKLWSNTNCNKSPKVLKALSEIVNRWDLDDPNDIAKLHNVTYDEWLNFIDDENPYTVAAFIEYIATEFYKANLRQRVSAMKHKKAEKRLQEFKLGKEIIDVDTSAA